MKSWARPAAAPAPSAPLSHSHPCSACLPNLRHSAFTLPGLNKKFFSINRRNFEQHIVLPNYIYKGLRQGGVGSQAVFVGRMTLKRKSLWSILSGNSSLNNYRIPGAASEELNTPVSPKPLFPSFPLLVFPFLFSPYHKNVNASSLCHDKFTKPGHAVSRRACKPLILQPPSKFSSVQVPGSV